MLVAARVTDAQAVRRPAWSVACIINDYEIDARELTATVTRCRLQEISLVQQPFDGLALVRERYELWAAAEYWRLMSRRVSTLQKMVEVMQEPINA